jgi:hypothetical protein
LNGTNSGHSLSIEGMGYPVTRTQATEKKAQFIERVKVYVPMDSTVEVDDMKPSRDGTANRRSPDSRTEWAETIAHAELKNVLVQEPINLAGRVHDLV